MKNYPEYPDNDDVSIKNSAEDSGITDFAVAKEIDNALKELQRVVTLNEVYKTTKHSQIVRFIHDRLWVYQLNQGPHFDGPS